MAKDLSWNPELKEATFSSMQKPKIEFQWRDDSNPEKIDFSDDIISASWTVEFEDEFHWISKSNFNVEISNENKTTGNVDRDNPWYFYFSNSYSINETVKVKLWYDHAWSWDKTIEYTKWTVTSWNASTINKTATLFAVDDMKSLQVEITSNALLSDLYPNELLSNIITNINTNYWTSLNLIIKSKNVSPNFDESLFKINYFTYDRVNAMDLIKQVCEASMWKFFINRDWDCEYWTYSYFADKINNIQTNYDFTASTDVPSDGTAELIPILDTGDSLEIWREWVINKVDVEYTNFVKKINVEYWEILMEIDSWETAMAEEYFDDKYIQTFDIISNWTIEAYEEDDYSWTDYWSEIVITNVNNYYSSFTFEATHSHWTYLYIKIKPKCLVLINKVTNKKSLTENWTSDVPLKSWADWDANFKLNKMNATSISNDLVQSKSAADNIAFWLIDLYRRPYRQLSFQSTGFPQIDVWDSIRVYNYIEAKVNILYGLLRRIDWIFNQSEGYLQTFFLQIYFSRIFDLSIYITELFNDTSKTSSMISCVIEWWELKLKYAGAWEESIFSINWFQICDRFWLFYNQWIANDYTSSEENIITRFNIQNQWFKTLTMLNNFNIIV